MIPMGSCCVSLGARSGIVVKDLATSRKVPGLRPDEMNFFNIPNLPAALGPEVHSSSNRNSYQKQKNSNVSVEGWKEPIV
jgi:hypothetical protein